MSGLQPCNKCHCQNICCHVLFGPFTYKMHLTYNWTVLNNRGLQVEASTQISKNRHIDFGENVHLFLEKVGTNLNNKIDTQGFCQGIGGAVRYV